MVPSYGVEVEATDEFHKKSDTIDSNIDYFTYELEGFEIGLIDGHYPNTSAFSTNPSGCNINFKTKKI